MNWQQTALHDLLRINSAYTTLAEHVIYKQASLHPYPRGVVLKGAKHGLDFPHKKQKRIRSGQFVISKRHVHQKIWGIVPPELDEAIVALGYLVFDIQPHLSVDYFAAYLSTARFRQEAFAACSRQGYLNVQAFTDIPIPLPSVEDQQRIAELWKSAKVTLEHTREMLSSIVALKSGVASELFGTINSSWEHKKLADCARIGQDRANGDALTVIPPDQIVLGDSLFGESGVGIQPDFEVDRRYLYYYLESQKSVLRSALNTTEIEARLKSLSLPLPTLYEQRKIAIAMQQHDEALLRIRAEHIELRKLMEGILHHIFNGTLDLQEALPILRHFSSSEDDKTINRSQVI
jgi:restriction endonuclease S subunit